MFAYRECSSTAQIREFILEIQDVLTSVDVKSSLSMISGNTKFHELLTKAGNWTSEVLLKALTLRIGAAV